MKSWINNQYILGIMTVAGIAVVLKGPYGYKGLGLFFGALALLRLLKLREVSKNRSAIEVAFATYEEVVGEQLYVVRDAETLAYDRCDSPREQGPIRCEYICRTRAGRWFLFNIAVSHGRIVDQSLVPCNEAEAKFRLQRHREAYVKCFGALPIA